MRARPLTKRQAQTNHQSIEPAPRGLYSWHHSGMTAPAPRLQFTSIRTRIEDEKPLIGLKHTAKTASGLPVSTTWIEMPPDDVARLVKSLQDALSALEHE